MVFGNSYPNMDLISSIWFFTLRMTFTFLLWNCWCAEPSIWFLSPVYLMDSIFLFFHCIHGFLSSWSGVQYNAFLWAISSSLFFCFFFGLAFSSLDFCSVTNLWFHHNSVKICLDQISMWNWTLPMLRGW